MTAVTALGGGFCPLSFFFWRKMTAKAVGAGSDALAVFDQYIGTAKAENAASTFKITASDGDTEVVKARNTIISRQKTAVFD